MRRLALVVILGLGLALPFLDKPVHVDEANLLALARAAAGDPWAPHAALAINWEGHTQPAFDVLANPPGLAWWLAPWAERPTWVLRLWMLCWWPLAAWGAARLGRAVGVGERLAVVLAASPLVVLHLPALLPDLPVLACTLAGLAGFLSSPRRRAWTAAWAVVAGAAVLFRYNGLVALGALGLAAAWRGRWRHAAWGLLPLALLAGHDLAAYGRVHLLSMVGFQAADLGPGAVLHRLAAGLGMLGLAGVLPVLAWNRRSPPWALAGAALGLGLALSWGHDPLQATTTTLAVAAGGVAVSALRWGRPEDRFLALWTLGGLAFLAPLRLVGGRYLLVFLAAPAAAALRLRPGRGRLAAACALSAALALGMAADDRELARAQERLAREVAPLGPAVFAGHWGWQHHLEARGWRPLEDGEPPPPLLAVSEAAWPQRPGPGCTRPIARLEAPARWPFPRVHTARGAANVHGDAVAGPPPVPTASPVGWGWDPYDVVTLLARCREEERIRDSGGATAPAGGP